MRNALVIFALLAILASATPIHAQVPTGACIDWSIQFRSVDFYGDGRLIQWWARVTASCGVDSGDIVLNTNRGYVNESIDLVCWCEWTNYRVDVMGFPPNLSARLIKK